MKILIIEDDTNKLKQIEVFLTENFSEVEIMDARSYQSGLKKLHEGSFDFVLLDMSLPTYDIKSGEDGYRFRRLAGQEILSELKRRRKEDRVIVVTQFETFGEGDNYIDLKDLKAMMEKDFIPNYLGTVYYNPGQNVWKTELKETIDNHL